MAEQIQARENIAEELKWDLTAIFATEELFEETLEKFPAKVSSFIEEFKGNLSDVDTVIAAIRKYEKLSAEASHLNQYGYLPISVDISDSEAMKKSRRIGSILAVEMAKLSFFHSEVEDLSEETLDEVSSKEVGLKPFIRSVKRSKKSKLSPDVEEALANLNPVLGAQSEIFEQARSADAEFESFTVDGKEYPLDFVTYEEVYMYDNNPEVRRKAYDNFNAGLAKYQNVAATAYYTQVQKEKILASMRGFDSIFDYLLDRQEVTREMYDRQIDLIMNDFAPVMRKYITHVKEQNGLEKMTYADLKAELDPEYTTPVTIEEAKELAEKAFSPLGKDYVDMITKAWPERWIDFARNKGKRSGAFCSTSYGVHPYVMLTWNDQLSDAYTLFHELGHAGQGTLAWENNSPSATWPSTYLIEGPSTFNELLLTDYLKESTDDPRMERSVISMMISKTYFHNFVTHLLEAAYQREVYKLIDAGDSFDAKKLSALKREVLEEFWGDAVEIEQGAELTWMRQIHYYMGLYPYTYSAGLTIATQAFLKIKSGEESVDGWLEFLAMGGEKVPAEATKVAGVDITTDQPLKDTIQYLDESIDRMIELTQEI